MKTFCEAALAGLTFPVLLLFNNDCDEYSGRPGLGATGVLILQGSASNHWQAPPFDFWPL
jgi:hypothetical protein